MTRSELSYFFTNKFCNIETEKDIVIYQRVEDHLIEAINNGLNVSQIIFIALEGSQNYKLDTPTSDVDTKLVITPTLDDIIYAHKLVSHTHIRTNDEHTGIFDIRFFFPTLKKQNINFMETLFSPWIIVNRDYEDLISIIIENRELIARYNPVKTVKTISGVATDRYKAITNLNSKRADIIKKYGYDGKSISHLIRVNNFLHNYLINVPYKNCLIPSEHDRKVILNYKEQKVDKGIASYIAISTYNSIQATVNNFIENNQEITNPEVDRILGNIQANIIKKALGVIEK